MFAILHVLKLIHVQIVPSKFKSFNLTEVHMDFSQRAVLEQN